MREFSRGVVLALAAGAILSFAFSPCDAFAQQASAAAPCKILKTAKASGPQSAPDPTTQYSV